MNKILKNKFYLCFLICDWVVCIWIAGLFLFANKINNYSMDNQSLTDAIVVLTGGRNRIAEGIELLENNFSDKLFISGVSKNVKLEDLEEKINKKISKKDKIEIGYKASNTIENAQEVLSWIKENKINSIRLVTSNYHILRSLEEFRAHNNDVKIIPHPVYSPNVSEEWWKNWGTFRLLFMEYNKFLCVYVLRRLCF